MQTICVGGQKGGTGKSTTVRELGSILTSKGNWVLMVDMDPQASLTASCGVTPMEERTIGEVLGGSLPGNLLMDDIIRDIGDGLWLAPSDIKLASVELGLTARMGREYVLRRALSVGRMADKFSVCLVDCPPSLGLLTVAGLVAADGVLIPCQPQAQDLRGLSLFCDTVRDIQVELNPGLQFIGVLVTFFDARLRHHQRAMEYINQAGLRIMGAIPRSVRIAEASGVAKPVTEYSPRNPTAEAYRKVAEEISIWLNQRTGSTL